MNVRGTLTQLRATAAAVPVAREVVEARLRELSAAEHARLDAVCVRLWDLCPLAVRPVLSALDKGNAPDWVEHDRVATEAEALGREAAQIWRPTDPPSCWPSDMVIQGAWALGYSPEDLARHEALLARRPA